MIMIYSFHKFLASLSSSYYLKHFKNFQDIHSEPTLRFKDQ